MESTIIGVRVANGSFVPVIDTSSKTRRRLVLTTIRDDQTSAQIDLYRAADEAMENAEYVGSLMIENIVPAAKGVADVALLLGVDESGNLNATATDKNSGEYQSLSVSLESIDQGGYNLPDFELSDEELTLDDLSMDEDELALDESAASLSLDDVTLEEDLSFDVESDEGSDTLATGEGLAGLEAFSEEMVSLDESLSDESASEIDVGGGSFVEVPEAAQVDATEDVFVTGDLPDLGDGMVEADLGDEDFTFDDVGDTDNIFDDGESLDGALDEEGASEAFALDNPADEITEFESGLQDDLASDDGFPGADLSSDELISTEKTDFGVSEFGDLESSPDAVVGSGEFGAAELDAAQPAPAPRRSNAIVFAGYIVLALAALGVLTYLVFRLLEGPPAPPLQAALPLFLIGVPANRRRRRHKRSRPVV